MYCPLFIMRQHKNLPVGAAIYQLRLGINSLEMGCHSGPSHQSLKLSGTVITHVQCTQVYLNKVHIPLGSKSILITNLPQVFSSLHLEAIKLKLTI